HTAQRLLQWAIDRYRETKQGPMLSRAGEIFAALTLGSFQRLAVDFEVTPLSLRGLRADGRLVEIAGMSEGTRDQLFLALRLAALELHLSQGQGLALPFIADDLFINYDDRRARAGLQALARLSQHTQVIFLSHHDHLVPTVREVFGAKVNIVTL
ncbi:ATP-binding protein, partial [Roseateles sp. GG27B]